VLYTRVPRNVANTIINRTKVANALGLCILLSGGFRGSGIANSVAIFKFSGALSWLISDVDFSLAIKSALQDFQKWTTIRQAHFFTEIVFVSNKY
jgi:hypothetical protein